MTTAVDGGSIPPISTTGRCHKLLPHRSLLIDAGLMDAGIRSPSPDPRRYSRTTRMPYDVVPSVVRMLMDRKM